MDINEEELNKKEQIINNLRLSKEPHIKETDKYEDFCFIMRITEWYLWKLREAKRAETLANHYYNYKRKHKQSATKRLWLTYAGFSLFYFVVFSCFGVLFKPQNIEFLHYAKSFPVLIIPSLITACFHFFLNFYIFTHIDMSGVKHLILLLVGLSITYLFAIFLVIRLTLFQDAKLNEIIELFSNLICPAIVISALHIWINNSIFYGLHKKDVEAYEYLKRIENQIREIDKNIIDIQERPVAESVRRWKESVDSGIKQLEEM